MTHPGSDELRTGTPAKPYRAHGPNYRQSGRIIGPEARTAKRTARSPGKLQPIGAQSRGPLTRKGSKGGRLMSVRNPNRPSSTLLPQSPGDKWGRNREPQHRTERHSLGKVVGVTIPNTLPRSLHKLFRKSSRTRPQRNTMEKIRDATSISQK